MLHHQRARSIVAAQEEHDAELVRLGQHFAALKAGKARKHAGCSSWEVFWPLYYGKSDSTANDYIALARCYRPEDVAGTKLGFTCLDGMRDLLEWLEGQEAVDAVDAAREALVARGLAR